MIKERGHISDNINKHHLKKYNQCSYMNHYAHRELQNKRQQSSSRASSLQQQGYLSSSPPPPYSVHL